MQNNAKKVEPNACEYTYVFYSKKLLHPAISLSALASGLEAGRHWAVLARAAARCWAPRVPFCRSDISTGSGKGSKHRHRTESFLKGRKKPTCVTFQVSHRRETMTVWAGISGQFQHFPASKDILAFLKTSDMTITFSFSCP